MYARVGMHIYTHIFFTLACLTYTLQACCMLSTRYIHAIAILMHAYTCTHIHAGGYITDRKYDPLIRQKVRKAFANGYYNGIVIGA